MTSLTKYNFYYHRQTVMLQDLDTRMDNIKFVLDARKEVNLDPPALQCSKLTSSLTKSKKKSKTLINSSKKIAKDLQKMHRKMMRKYLQLKD